jgi:hypothetical protein
VTVTSLLCVDSVNQNCENEEMVAKCQWDISVNSPAEPSGTGSVAEFGLHAGSMKFEIFAFLGCYATWVGSYRCFEMTDLFHLQGSGSPRRTFHGDATDRLSRNVGKYQYTPRNIREE